MPSVIKFDAKYKFNFKKSVQFKYININDAFDKNFGTCTKIKLGYWINGDKFLTIGLIFYK